MNSGVQEGNRRRRRAKHFTQNLASLKTSAQVRAPSVLLLLFFSPLPPLLVVSAAGAVSGVVAGGGGGGAAAVLLLFAFDFDARRPKLLTVGIFLSDVSKAPLCLAGVATPRHGHA